MLNFKQIVTFAYDCEYENAYDLKIKKNFSTPKIYNAKGDLTKRWYVYFSFRNPETGKLKRMTPIYGDANAYKTKEDRLQVLTQYRKTIIKLLNQGFSPFENNIEAFENLKKPPTIPEIIKEEPKPETPILKVVEEKIVEEPKMLVKEAFDFALNYKKKLVGVTTMRSYENRDDYFLRWLTKNYPELKTIDKLSKKLMLTFLNETLERTTARTRNNYRTELGAIFQVLEDNEIIESNFVKKINVLKSTPNRNKTYTDEQQQVIFEYLEKHDKVLLLFIKFISYNFLRPIEVCRLQIKDININTRTVQFKAKNSPLKTKIIPEILWKELPDLTQFNPEDFLFTNDGIGGTWDTKINNKRDFYSKRFKKVVKEKFDLGVNYGLYSFRHTFITKLYRAMVKDSSPYEAKSKLMLITGHATMTALEKYLRDIDAELPADYSEML
ncbi:tyrosine-type recombinase/integrase [Lacinutrix chionoecetis]